MTHIEDDLEAVMLRLAKSERDALHRLLVQAMRDGEENAKAEAQAKAEPQAAQPRRRPSIATLIARAEKQGKAVTQVTTPDGTTLHFEPQPTGASNPWLADLEKVTKQ